MSVIFTQNTYMYVIFLYGPAAAGKYTIGQLLSEQLNIPLFHNHLVVDVAHTLFEFGTEGFKQLRADLWQRSFAVAAEYQQAFIFTFNPEATVDPALISALATSITEQGGHIHYVELTCSDEVVMQRLNNPSRQAFGKLTDVGLYQKIKLSGGFDFPVFCEPAMVIDTGSHDAKTVAAKIIGRFSVA